VDIKSKKQDDGITYYEYELYALDAINGPHTVSSVTAKVGHMPLPLNSRFDLRLLFPFRSVHMTCLHPHDACLHLPLGIVSRLVITYVMDVLIQTQKWQNRQQILPVHSAAPKM
jgi:hypothetical protein